MPEFGFVQRDWRAGTSIVDISDITYDPEGIHRLCRPAVWTASVNLQDPRASSLVPLSTSLQVTFEGTTVFHGFTWRIHRTGDLDKAKAQVTWIDPSIWWAYRVVRDMTGNFSYPDFPVGASGGKMLRDAIIYSEAYEGLPPSGPPAPMAIAPFGSDTSFVDLSARPVSFPMKILDLALLLGSTGRSDWQIAPALAPGRMGELVVRDRMGSATGIDLVYGPGGNCSQAEFIEDADSITTALWYFIGPKEDEQHWLYNIQLDDPGLPNQAAIASVVHAQRNAIGLWQDMRFFDGADSEDELSDPAVRAERRLLRRMWEMEQMFRQKPRELMHLSPVDGTIYPWADFYLGDKIDGFVPGLGTSKGGTQRIYGFKIRPGNESKPEVELLTSNTEAP